MPTISIVEKFRDEFEAHLDGKPCPYERRVGDLTLVESGRKPMADPGQSHHRRQGRSKPPPGTLVIEAAKRNGIEIPAFCYYEGLSAAGRLPHVPGGSREDAEADGGLHAAGGRRHGGAHRIRARCAQARKATLEFLLTNHPLDCPVCDKGGECELQDMVFRYGAGESRFTETQAARRREAVVAGGVLRRAALHSLLPLRAHLQRRHGRGARWASSIAAWFPRSRPTTAITWSATSAACASTSARWAR